MIYGRRRRRLSGDMRQAICTSGVVIGRTVGLICLTGEEEALQDRDSQKALV